jgi:hypothetical protein
MTKLCVIKFLILLFFCTSALGQKKPKYKDLYSLLSTRQYETAEPFLKKYLAAEDGNPNAFLYMGIIYQEKANANDILKETQNLLSNIDSAMYFFDKASGGINDREIRKNKEYYQAYNRRDLRTGEFGVKLSDIQFDIEKRKEGLTDRRQQVSMIKYYFQHADSLYRKCTSLFNSIKHTYPTKQTLFLQAGDSTIRLLKSLAVRFDSTLKFIGYYQSSLENLVKMSYNQTFELQEISDFENDGSSPADFLAEDVHLWDYKKFSDDSRHVMVNDIEPLREELVSLDMRANKLEQTLRRDSLSVKKDLDQLNIGALYERLKRFDDNPLPVNVLKLKIADLSYHSSVLEARSLADSMNVDLQLSLVQDEYKELCNLDSLADVLINSDLEASSPSYAHFISTAYNNITVLKTYVKGIKEYAVREKIKLADTLKLRRAATGWIHVQNEDIPLFEDDSLLIHRPLLTADEKYTVGLKYLDSVSVSGYFYTVTPSRIPDIQVTFPVDLENFTSDRFPSVKTLVTDTNSLIYYIVIYSQERSEEKIPATVAKIYRSDGLSWSENYRLDFVPESVTYNTESGELVVSADQQTFVLDKNGKRK